MKLINRKKFAAKNWVETNYAPHEAYNSNRQIKFKTTMLRSSLRDYSDAYILVKRTKQPREQDQMHLQAVTRQIDEINNMEIDTGKYLHVVISTYNLR